MFLAYHVRLRHANFFLRRIKRQTVFHCQAYGMGTLMQNLIPGLGRPDLVCQHDYMKTNQIEEK